MADYKVGNLQIVFDTLNQTDEGFKKLVSNLRSVQKAISKIGDTDLKPFVANMKQVVKSFSPLLTNISGASDSIIALNQAIQKVGTSKLSKVAQEFDGARKIAEDTTNAVDDLTRAENAGNQTLEKTSTALVAVSSAQAQANVEFENLNKLLSYNSYDKVLASVGGLAKAWRNLYTTYSQISGVADKLTGGMFSPEAANRLQSISDKYFRQKEIVEQTNKAFREMEEQYRRSKLSAEELTIEEYRQVEASRKQRIEFLEAALALGKAGENTEAYKKELAELTGKINESENATKKGANGFKKFIKSIGRIALYRAIRRALQLIIKSLIETAQEFAKVDDNVNNTMSSITSSLQVIKLSFGATFLPLLEIIAPLLNQIATAFANFANTISQATAKGDTYWAINSEAIQDYREQLNKTTGTLAQFDKVNTLNQKDDKSIFFEEREVDKENQKVKETRTIIESIRSIIFDIGEILANVIEIAAPLLGSIVQVVNAISPIISKLSKLFTAILVPQLKVVADLITNLFDGVLGDVLDGIAYALQFIVDIINGDFKSAFKSMVNSFIVPVNLILSTIEFLVNAAIKIINGFLDAFSLTYQWLNIFGLNLPSLGQISTVKLPRMQYQDFAMGGLPDKGTLFRAGEAGAELVYNTPSGQSGVANVSQIQQAMYNALVEYSNRNRNNSDSAAININIDGQKVFEATRRTAVKRGLDFTRV